METAFSESQLGELVRCKRCKFEFELPSFLFVDEDSNSPSITSLEELDLKEFGLHDGQYQPTTFSPTYQLDQSLTQDDIQRNTSDAGIVGIESNTRVFWLFGIVAACLVFIFMATAVGVGLVVTMLDRSKAGGTASSENAIAQTVDSGADQTDHNQINTLPATQTPEGVVKKKASPSTSKKGEIAPVTELTQNAKSWVSFARQASIEKNELLVQFVREDNRRRLRFRNRNSNQEDFKAIVDLPDGEGLELAQAEETKQFLWRWTATPTSVSLIDDTLISEQYHVKRLKATHSLFSQERVDSENESERLSVLSCHHHVWSNDGRFLYVVELDRGRASPQQVLKIDTETWTVVARMQLNYHVDHISGICLTSEGLVLLASFSTSGMSDPFESDLICAEGAQPWSPLITPTGYRSRLFVVDTDTLNPKKALNLPRYHRIAGRAQSDIVYAVTKDANIAVINVRTGHLLNVVSQWTQLDLRFAEKGLKHPTVSPDGKWLYSSRMDDRTSVSRYRLSGSNVTLEKNVDVEMIREDIDLSTNGELLTVQDNEGFITLRSDDLSKVQFRTKGPKQSRFVYDSESKVAYICGQEYVKHPLVFTAIGESGTQRFELKSGDLPAGGNDDPRLKVPGSLNPYGMSIAPQNRGVIVFAYDATYWIEPIQNGATIAATKPPEVKKSAYQDGNDLVVPKLQIIKGDTRDALPEPTECKLKLTLKTKEANLRDSQSEKDNGALWAAPFGFSISCFTSDPISGDIAMVLQGSLAETEPITNILFIVRDAALKKGDGLIKSAIVSKILTGYDITFKQVNNKNYLVLVRDDVMWVLDPLTLKTVSADAEIVSPIDLRTIKLSEHDQMNYPWKLPAEAKTKLSVDRVFASRDDSPFILCRFASEGSPLQVKVDLTNGKAEKTDVEPSWSKWNRQTQWGDSRVTYSPHEKMTRSIAPNVVQTSGVKEFERDEIQLDGAQPITLMTKYPYLLGMSPTSLRIYTQRGLKLEKEVPYPKEFLNSNARSALLGQVCDDFPRERLIVLAQVFEKESHAMGIWLLPTNVIELPDLPSLAVRIDVPEYVKPEKEVRIPITLFDRRAKIALLQCPETAKLVGNEIVWTPKETELGEQRFFLDVSSGTQTERKEFSCKVQYLASNFESSIQSIAFSKDGTKAALVATDLIALLDVRGSRVLAMRPTSRRASQVSFTNDAIYVLYSDSSILEKRKLDDLSLDKTLQLTRNIQAMRIVGDRFLFLYCEAQKGIASLGNTNSRFFAFELPNFNQSKQTELFDSSPYAIEETADGGWHIGPVVMDASLKSINSIVDLNFTNAIRLNEPDGGGVGLSTTPSDAGCVAVGNQGDQWRYGTSYTLTSKAIEEAAKPGAKRFRSVYLEIKNHETNTTTVKKLGVTPILGTPKLACSDSGLVVSIGPQFYSASLEELGMESPLGVPGGVEPLKLQPVARVSAISPKRKFEVRFAISGGSPPYHLDVSMPVPLSGFVIKNIKVESTLVPDTKKRSITIAGDQLVDVALQSIKEMDSCIAKLSDNSMSKMGGEERLNNYIDTVSNKLKPLTKQVIKDFPVRLPIDVRVRDAESKEVTLRHELVLLLPRQSILTKLKATGDVAARKREDRRSAERAYKAVIDGQLFSFNGDLDENSLPVSGLPAIWDGGPIELSEELRRRWIHKELSPGISLQAVAAVNSVLNNARYLVESGGNGPSLGNGKKLVTRQWTLRDGHQVTGVLHSYTPHVQSVKIAKSAEEEESRRDYPAFVEFRLTQLSNESISDLFTDMRLLPLDTLEGWARKPSLKQGVARFAEDFGCLPPPAIVDAKGKPLLSWRVMLLPYLGHRELFELFRLDEPWDSPHNKQLIPYMPFIYRPSSDAEVSKATLLALTGPDTPFPGDKLCRSADFPQKAEELLLFLEVRDEKAVEWTKPEDITLQKTMDWAMIMRSWTPPQNKSKVAQGWFGDGTRRVFSLSDE